MVVKKYLRGGGNDWVNSFGLKWSKLFNLWKSLTIYLSVSKAGFNRSTV